MKFVRREQRHDTSDVWWRPRRCELSFVLKDRVSTPHLQSLHYNLQNSLQDNQHFQHCCHPFYFLKYPGQVGNQPLQEGTNPLKKSLYYKKGPKFSVTPATIHTKEYISTATVAALQAGELNSVDCSGLYHDVNRILNTYTNKPIHTNITEAKHLALENLNKDKDCFIVTADSSGDRCRELMWWLM